MGNIVVTSKNSTRIWIEGQEVCREYYKTDTITFGMSELPPGGVGDLDVGHSEADEVFFCVQGDVLCYCPEEVLIITLFQETQCWFLRIRAINYLTLGKTRPF